VADCKVETINMNSTSTCWE